MTLAITLTWPTLADALSLGGIYALMAVGIGLVFGVLRLVNFAYGQLIMAGAYAVAYASVWGWPTWAGILFCFGVVLALTAAMDRLVFRPLRTQSPAVMLVATFAVAFLMQSIAVLAFGQLGTIASSVGPLNQPWFIHGVAIRKIAIISIAVAAFCLGALQLLLTRTSVGLHMRAAAMDFRTARILGVRANRVIGGAVLISGLLAAVSALMLTARNPQVTPIFGLDDTIIVLAGVVLGGLNRPISATLGGFLIGFTSGILGGVLPTNQSQYLPSLLFAAVIAVLLLRPNGLFAPRGGAVERL
jgi:branched-chain amino acid transport system permease protein